MLLTTQYLEEADELADRIVVIDHGTVVEEGTADELKDRTGGRTLHIEVLDPDGLTAAAATIAELTPTPPDVDLATRTITVAVGTDTELAATAITRLNAAGIHIDDFRLERPSLDDVFLTLTGHSAPTEETPTS